MTQDEITEIVESCDEAITAFHVLLSDIHHVVDNLASRITILEAYVNETEDGPVVRGFRIPDLDRELPEFETTGRILDDEDGAMWDAIVLRSKLPDSGIAYNDTSNLDDGSARGHSINKFDPALDDGV